MVPRTLTASLLDENSAFFQVGFVRNISEVVATITIDHVIEATTLAEATPKKAR